MKKHDKTRVFHIEKNANDSTYSFDAASEDDSQQDTTPDHFPGMSCYGFTDIREELLHFAVDRSCGSLHSLWLRSYQNGKTPSHRKKHERSHNMQK